MKNVFIEGRRIHLRVLQPSDVDGNYINWFNDAEVCRYNSHHVYPYTKSDAQEYIEKVRKAKDVLVLAIVTKGGCHIGNVSLQKISLVNRSAEFAIIIGEQKFWGKGFAKEASRLLIEHGFKQMNLNRIYCGTSADNVPMQELARSLGMKREGRRRQAMFKSSRYVDIVEFGLLKREFKSA